MGSLYDWRYLGFVLVCVKVIFFNFMGVLFEGELLLMRMVEIWYWLFRSLGIVMIM